MTECRTEQRLISGKYLYELAVKEKDLVNLPNVSHIHDLGSHHSTLGSAHPADRPAYSGSTSYKFQRAGDCHA